MNSFPVVNIRQFSKLRVFALAALLVLLRDQHLNAQVGGDNPTGVAGGFNGQITTDCSYDAYTGNATRSVTDIAVAGAVGEYPLALVRTANSRRAQTSNTANPFGVPGHWNHSYNWILEDSGRSGMQPFQPSSYTVEFPDGRVETFSFVDWDPGYYRVRAIGGDQSTAAGIRERLMPMNPPQGNMVVKLYLPDGGRVEFVATLKQSAGLWYYSYVAQAIYDSHGLPTTFTHDGSGRLTTVTDPTGPTGRYLQFSYRTPVGQTQILDHVTEWINSAAQRIVQYNYTNVLPGGQIYLALTSVSYFSQWTATYTYCAPNISPPSGVPLLKTCDDPMYSGPMHKIGYVYRTATNPDGSTPPNGQVQSENYYDGTVGVAVSTLAVAGTNTRRETRADGKARSLTYGTGDNSGFLTSWTDFTGHGAAQTHDYKGYINSVTDRNNHTTNYTLDPITGNVTQVQFPAIATPSPAPRGTLNYTYTSNYYLHTSQDEGGHQTTYTRDGNNRVTRIDYRIPDMRHLATTQLTFTNSALTG
jgi:YD repeat-containing protein